jgi:hypothetical protein
MVDGAGQQLDGDNATAQHLRTQVLAPVLLVTVVVTINISKIRKLHMKQMNNYLYRADKT